MWWIKSKCEHVFEVVTRGEQHYSNAACITYYKTTKATCITCGYVRTINTVPVRYIGDGELVAVHSDPLGIYSGILDGVQDEKN